MDPLTTARFFTNTVPDPVASQKEGRPMFKDQECVEIIHPADKLSRKVFPAHEVCGTQRIDEHGFPIEETYATRFNPQYRAYKEGKTQTMEGTPLSELPFLSEAKRRELRALSIYTAETLAALDGQPLKNLGQGGRDLKNQAEAYLVKAKENVDFAALSAQVAELKSQNEALKTQVAAIEPAVLQGVVSPFEDWEDEDIKVFLAENNNGKRPLGNPGHKMLVGLADELNAELKKKAKAA